MLFSFYGKAEAHAVLGMKNIKVIDESGIDEEIKFEYFRKYYGKHTGEGDLGDLCILMGKI